MKKKKNKKRPVPLAPPPSMRSRKRARWVTTRFHKLTRERDLAMARGDDRAAQETQQQIEEMGGRQEYQRASQLSTSFHSTSKWVLRVLARLGWIHGIPSNDNDNNNDDNETQQQQQERRSSRRRDLRLLEVGAINTELLDAAKETRQVTRTVQSTGGTTTTIVEERKRNRLSVRAIDLHSMHDGIETADFLTLPPCQPKMDVIVCSMVLNCVTTPQQRGVMLARLYHQLRPQGLCFLTLPKLCLTQSPFLTKARFLQMLSGGVGFHVQETKESPKVCFFILQRPTHDNQKDLDPQWTQQTTLFRGKKFRNPFAVVLQQDQVNGKAFGATKCPANDKASGPPA